MGGAGGMGGCGGAGGDGGAGAMGGSGGGGGSTGGAGGGGAGGGSGGAGGGGDAGTRGFCNSDADCVFQPNDGCCGTCLAKGDPVIPPGPVCSTVACVRPPGGCSCVLHMCTNGILTMGATCDPQLDTCGLGLKCCRSCGAQNCVSFTCATMTGTSSNNGCPAVP
jgi:hypothetical protein